MSAHLKKLSLLAFLLLASVSFAACSSTKTAPSEDAAPGMTTEKKGDTTLTGKLTNKGGKYFLTVSGKQPQEVESYSIDLATYTDKTVTITGQFSGSTLFAGKIVTE